MGVRSVRDDAGRMTTLHIANHVHDYDGWKAAFDKFDRHRAENGVREYRINRVADDPQRVDVDLDFDTRAEAEAFAVALQRIWATPQSRAQLIDHAEPVFLERVETRVLHQAAG